MNDIETTKIPRRFAGELAREQSWLRKMTPYAYRLEPIIDLKSENFVGAEILRDGPPFLIVTFWHGWYSRIGDLHDSVPDQGNLFINLHTHQIVDEVLMDRLISGLRDPRRVVLEWTEFCAAGDDLGPAAEILKEVRKEHGVMISVDDFGAGVDGVQRLSLVSPDIVKIDGSMLHSARGMAPARTLLKNMVHLVQDAGAKAVTEWIETDDDLKIARDAGADWGQGFYWPHSAGTL